MYTAVIRKHDEVFVNRVV